MTGPTADGRVDEVPSSHFAGGVVTILVGSTPETFQVHENLLRSRSDFFAAALKPGWTEGVARQVRLPEEEPCMFQRYVQHLYAGTLACKKLDVIDTYLLLADLYGLGERLQDLSFRDDVITALLATNRATTKLPGLAVVNKIYSQTMSDCPARKVMTDIYTLHAYPSSLLDADDFKPARQEFLADLACSLVNKRNLRNDEESEITALLEDTTCEYHSHEKGHECPAKRRRIS